MEAEALLAEIRTRAGHAVRLLALTAAGLLLLAGLAFVTLLLFVDPDRFKPRIEAAAQSRLGRQLSLSGDLRWRLYPWLVIESDGGALSSPPAFAGEGFARWERLRFGVRVRPLFDGRAEIDSVEVDGLELRLIRDAQGRVNWSLPDLPAARAADPSVTMAIGRVVLRDALVSGFDARSGRRFRAERLGLSFALPSLVPGAPVVVRDLQVDARIFGEPFSSAGVPVEFEADSVTVDPSRQTLAVPAFVARFGPARIEGQVEARGGSEPEATGRLALSTPSLRGLLSAGGIEAPPTRDGAALGQFELESPVEFADRRLLLAPLSLHLDDTRLTGRVAVTPDADPRFVFDLTADTLRADRYLEPADVAGEPFELPLAQLKAVKARGRLAVGQVDLLGVRSTGVTVEVE